MSSCDVKFCRKNYFDFNVWKKKWQPTFSIQKRAYFIHSFRLSVIYYWHKYPISFDCHRCELTRRRRRRQAANLHLVPALNVSIGWEQHQPQNNNSNNNYNNKSLAIQATKLSSDEYKIILKHCLSRLRQVDIKTTYLAHLYVNNTQTDAHMHTLMSALKFMCNSRTQ